MSRPVLLASLGLAAAVGVGGCAHAAAKTTTAGPAFDDQHQAAVSCMQHQTKAPTAAYSFGAKANTELVFYMLHYYTANGNKPYCGGAGPTAVDRQWLSLYTKAGASPTNVRRYLAAGRPS